MRRNEMLRVWMASGDKSHVPSVSSPPCPLCRKRLKLERHWTSASIFKDCYRHFRICPVRQDRLEAFYSGSQPSGRFGAWQRKCTRKRQTWQERCYAAVIAARPKHVPLSSREIRRRQVRAGKKLSRAARRRGGRNQAREYKSLGGEKGMHQRWHVARGVRNPKCSLCRA